MPQVTVSCKYDLRTFHQSNLEDYRKICGFADNGKVPITDFFCVITDVTNEYDGQKPFPFATLGLVHVDNSVTQYRPIGERETVAMAVEVRELTRPCARPAV